MYMRVFVFSMMLPYAALAATSAGDSLITISLTSGAHLRGFLSLTSGDSLEFVTTGGVRIWVPRSAVVPVEPPAGSDIRGASRVVRPPVSGRRIVGELLAGAGLGIGGGMVTYLIGGAIMGERDPYNGDGDRRRTETVCMAGGYAVGAALGVTAVGCHGDQTGSFWCAAAGSLVAVAPFVIASAILSSEAADPEAADPLGFLGMIGAPVCAFIGFNATRQWRQPTLGGTFLDIDRLGIALGVPAATYRANRQGGSVRRDVTLVRMRF